MLMNDLYKTTMQDIIKSCDIANLEIHHDDKNIIRSIEVKYVPADQQTADAIKLDKRNKELKTVNFGR